LADKGDVANGQQRWVLMPGQGNVGPLAFRGDGLVLAGGAFRGVQLWSVEPRPLNWPTEAPGR
jgi:hypothetical protein